MCSLTLDEDNILEDSSDLEESWAGEDALFDESPNQSTLRELPKSYGEVHYL